MTLPDLPTGTLPVDTSLALDLPRARPPVAAAPGRLTLLALAGLGLGLVALGLVWLGQGRVAIVVASSAVTLMLLSGALALLAGRGRRQRDQLGAVLAQALAQDPDAISVTDRTGRVSAANAQAAAVPDPAERLHGWCVEPGRMLTTLLAEVEAKGATTREFHRQDKALRVTAHQADGGSDLVIWRFSALGQGGGRGLDALGLPIVSRTAQGYSLNAAARTLIDPADDLASLLAGMVAEGPAMVSLPGGASLRALGVAARDGVLDLVLLPAELTLPASARPAASGPDFDEIPVALAQLDAECRITGTNRLARTLLGLGTGDQRYFWEVVEGLGRPVADWLVDARAGRALGRPEVLRATLTGQEAFVQIILRRGVGGALVAVISDATELKSLEARFVQSQKMQAIGQLAGGIAHDFNNLLTAIAGHCDLLLLNRDRFDPDYDDLLQIHQNANRAAALVRQLLAFSRKQTLKTEVLTLESLLEDLTHLLTRLVGERIVLTLEHDPELGAIRADRRQLEQVIMNLVVNARDAMPMGGTIRIETQALRLSSEMEHGRARVPAGDYALILVVDEGIGIAADIIDKIFEPFFTTKKVGEGTGLGLSTAYGIVKQMGGYIFCNSVEGSGTVFTLYFALAEPRGAVFRGTSADLALEPPRTPPPTRPAIATPRSAPAPDPAAAANRGRSILLVEDEAPVRAFAARALRHHGYQVFEAQDGEQALEFLQETAVPIDLFVTDVIMPGIDGPGWVTQALNHRPGTPVVFVSGYTEDTLSAALSRIPRAVFLGKPFSLQDLTATIARQLAP